MEVMLLILLAARERLRVLTKNQENQCIGFVSPLKLLVALMALLVSVSLPEKQRRPRAEPSPERPGRGRQFGIALA